MEKISYKIDCFEGPMDLLLHLISKHKVSINDVPILELVEQYLAAVRQMELEDLDVASEFLEMAARLVYIKTVSLLPVHEEADQLAQELRGELLAYQDCKYLAGKLGEQANGFGYFDREPVQFPVDMRYTRLHEPYEIFKAYISAVGKGKRRLPPPVEAFSRIVAHRIVSVQSRVVFLLERLTGTGRNRFLSLFDASSSRSEMVATFLAILSLCKAKRVVIEGDGDQATIELKQVAEESD
jgi:segregation and condensation protein A